MSVKPEIYSSSHGFEIIPPPSISTSFSMQPNNGFAATVSVVVQNYPGSINEYDAVSLKQFSQLGWTVTTRTLEENELRYEYTGIKNGKQVNFYCRAVKDQNKMYLITAVDHLENWNLTKDALINSVNSFKKS